MARDFAKAFYKSKRWKNVRDRYMRMGDGLCEPCLARGRFVPAKIVHHKVHLNEENINDPAIAVGIENLERVCMDCHAKEHPEIYGDRHCEESRVSFDASGNVVRKEGR